MAICVGDASTQQGMVPVAPVSDDPLLLSLRAFASVSLATWGALERVGLVAAGLDGLKVIALNPFWIFASILALRSFAVEAALVTFGATFVFVSWIAMSHWA
ncbi:hypothetical protein AG1IA_08899 [Rhizoctonia solani AG-1 IA]|uniref:Uncharacterized protein n=1 Tax=Thanatephorus cucumeris (strain AG1-IA) TaxID=983506 RepID=L8WJT8_THACA|nr:hypothetical protein AG1IA_08899 [Rhizoctonia solani AG-1 IA]